MYFHLNFDYPHKKVRHKSNSRKFDRRRLRDNAQIWKLTSILITKGYSTNRPSKWNNE